MSIWKYFGLGPKAETRRDEASVTNHSAGDDYYPAAAGLELRHFTNLALELIGEDVTVSVEASVRGTYWVDVTRLVLDAGACVALTGPLILPAGGTSNYLLDLGGIPYPLVRFKARFRDATNSLEINLSSNERGGVVLPPVRPLVNANAEMIVRESAEGGASERLAVLEQMLIELKRLNIYQQEITGSEVLDSDVQ